MADSPHSIATAAPAPEVRLITELMRLCRVMLLYGDPGAQRDHLLRSEILPVLQPFGPGGHRELVILFDAWSGSPLADLHARIRAALAQISAAPIPDGERCHSLADVLRLAQEACDATFLFVFDRFNEYLMAPSQDDSMREFEDEFVQAANDATLRANFLLVLDQDGEALLERLRDRIPFRGSDSVRLPPAKQLPQQTAALDPTEDALSTAGVEQAVQHGDAPSPGAVASEETTPIVELARPAPHSPPKLSSMTALATIVLICGAVGAAIWVAQRSPQPAAAMTEQQAVPAGVMQKNVMQHPAPPKGTAINEPRERMKSNEPERSRALPKAAKEQGAPAAAKAKPQMKPDAATPKPRATGARPNNKNAVPVKERPKAAPTVPRNASAPTVQPPPKSGAPSGATNRAARGVAAAQPKLTVDQIYEQRAGAECAQGLAGLLCRTKLNQQLCAGKWTREEQPGLTRCYLW